jgi:hypothetical protein
MVIDMDELESFRETHLVAISRGESIYIELAKEASIEPLDALNSMRSMLSDPWNEPEYFLAALGKGDVLAMIETRSHFNLPPME